MRALFVASEVYPLAKTGGLGDVCRALPIALSKLGVDARLLLPGYPSALDAIAGHRVEAVLDGLMGVERARLIAGHLPGTRLPVWLIDAPSLYRRDGNPYQDSEGRAWPDNARRFAFLSKVGALVGLGFAADWKPDVVHAHDWHTGLVPMMMAQESARPPASVFTIHNLAFQGNFPLDEARRLGLPESCLTPDGLEFHGQASFMKAGIRYADRITTVSRTYAQEILTREFGCGMEGLLQHRRADLVGILNGAEYGLWDPSGDPCLPARYNVGDIGGKRICKDELQRSMGLPVSRETPLLGFVSRLTDQKMADVLIEAVPWIVGQGLQLVVHGQGDAALEGAFSQAAAAHPDHVAVRVGYDEASAHRLQAGADMLLAPARYEPCGLTQLYAMRYGSLPVVRRTGGLADSVVNANRRTLHDRTATGFKFDKAEAPDLVGAMARAVRLFRQPLAWRRLQLQAMAQDYSWDRSARAYLALYRDVTGSAGSVQAPLEVAAAAMV